MEIFADGKYYEEVSLCGGSIISDTHILFAAHCIGCSSFNYIDIKFGESVLNEGDVIQSAYPPHVLIHERFCPKDHFLIGDIALINLPKKLIFSKLIQPIRLPSDYATNSMLEGRRALISGWGLTEKGKLASTLQAARVKIATQSDCKLALVPTDHLCANVDNKITTCTGDSGGPLVIDRILYGVTSWGRKNQSELLPKTKQSKLRACENRDVSTYTSVIYYLDWIKEKTGLLPGTEAKPKELPYFVRITSYFNVSKHRKKSVNCAGALISASHVLTTAHCIKLKQLSCKTATYVQTRFGLRSLSDLGEKSEKITPENLIVHKDFDCFKTPLNDIAVIRLPNPLVLSETIKPIKLPTQLKKHGKIEAKFGSFCSTHYGVQPNFLRIHKLVVSAGLCAQGFLCGNTSHLSVCNIDSGAPVVRGSVLYGMVSLEPKFKQNCVSSNISEIVSIAKNSDWIKAQISVS
ncbi:transmembrane protease serine 9-like isoform X2 [Anthonomus grandis grandis]|nr:transmembrane protease serine 9-like isoform X2 [Anthonomus grandis grandis]XP_050295932.1 transmembrane protease serine 9-like isoform X2 [Anthonomus grandis grandis]